MTDLLGLKLKVWLVDIIWLFITCNPEITSFALKHNRYKGTLFLALDSETLYRASVFFWVEYEHEQQPNDRNIHDLGMEIRILQGIIDLKQTNYDLRMLFAEIPCPVFSANNLCLKSRQIKK